MRSFVVRACLGLLATGALASGMLAAGPADASAAIAPHWRVTVISPPANQASALTAVACPTSTWCAAAGWYGPQAPEIGGQSGYFTIAASHGKWSPATNGVLPPDARPGVGANVNGIACTGKGSCVAVGTYAAREAGPAFIAVEQHGAWQRAFRPSLPRNAARPADAVLFAVTCTGPGSCEAVGSYYDKTGHFLPMSMTESGGRWHRATGIELPPHATRGQTNSLVSIACTHAGSCIAVGRYTTTQDTSYAADAALEVKGHWLRAARLNLPAGAGPVSQLNSVSCQSSGQCVAVGTFELRSADYSMMATLSHGQWSNARPLRRIPSGAPRGAHATLTAVSCARTFCLAAGAYSLRNGTREWIVIRIEGGAWRTATEIRVPAGRPFTFEVPPTIAAASCSQSGACAAVGWYQNESGDSQALAAIGG